MTLTDPATSVHAPAGTTTDGRGGPSRGRRVGYVVGVGFDLGLLYLVNVRPGWEALPFVTDDAALVLGAFNLALVVGVVASAAYLVYDPPWFRSLGDLVTTAVGLVALVRVCTVFPFDFSAHAFDWTAVVRVVLVLVTIAASLGVVVNVAQLVARLVRAVR